MRTAWTVRLSILPSFDPSLPANLPLAPTRGNRSARLSCWAGVPFPVAVG
jgi:hypothetical protein